MTGDWEAWLDFFAEAVIVTATQAVETALQLLDLSNQDRDKISGLGRAAASTLQVHRALMEHPIATSGSLVEKIGITPATVNKALGHLEQLGIVNAGAKAFINGLNRLEHLKRHPVTNGHDIIRAGRPES